MTLTQIKRQEMDSQVGSSSMFWETHVVGGGTKCGEWGLPARLPDPGQRQLLGKAQGVKATDGFAQEPRAVGP